MKYVPLSAVEPKRSTVLIGTLVCLIVGLSLRAEAIRSQTEPQLYRWDAMRPQFLVVGGRIRF